MKTSIRWIKELLPSLRAKPEAIEAKLGTSGFEVEGREDLARRYAGVVVGEVTELAPHEGADNLRVARVSDGEDTFTVVCGAPNVAAGQRVCFAKLGARLPNGMVIERRVIRGVESSGMLCSAAELGLSEDGEGLLVLGKRARVGRSLAEELGLEDVLLEVAVTPNRPDVLSHHGLARELAALFDVERPRLRVRVKEAKVAARSLAKVEVVEADRCPKYAARVITGVTIGRSPEWLERRLRALGQRPISNVVDATNLVLLELGHPLHAFDLDKLTRATEELPAVIVRRAAPGERLQTIDGVDRALDGDDLVIADRVAPLALAGVMGGLGSAVGDGTKNLLLESAWFDPKSVRRTSKRHALHTEASHRFERGADRGMVEAALDRCAELILELAGGQVAGGRIVVESKAPAAPVVYLRPERASRVLGREVDRREVKASLTALGLRAVHAPKGRKRPKLDGIREASWFEVPSWRVDLRREEDLIEEVGRLAGYDRIPTEMPPSSRAVWTAAPARDPERRLRDVLVGEGFLESISLAFNSRREVEAFALDPAAAVGVQNPLGEESALLRMTMLPALLRAARHNQDVLPSITDLRLFEVGRTFAWANPAGELPVERHQVGLIMRGKRLPPRWCAKDAKGLVPALDAYDVKGVLEVVLAAHGAGDVAWVAHEAPWLHPRSGTRVVAPAARGGRGGGALDSAAAEGGEQVVAVFGELHPDVMSRFGLEGPPLFVAELDLEVLFAHAGGHASFRPLPRHPPARRDLSFFLAREVEGATVLSAIRGAPGAANLELVELFDVYEGQGLPEGKRSLAVAMTFRAPDRTLTDAEVVAAEAAIVTALGALGAEIRSA